jgi:hypothetical protein
VIKSIYGLIAARGLDGTSGYSGCSTDTANRKLTHHRIFVLRKIGHSRTAVRECSQGLATARQK